MTGKNATEMLEANRAGITRAARILQSGGLVAVPTETVYGLAARADDPVAVAGIYAAKGRPGFNPLIVHVDTVEQAEALAEFSERARRIA
ncbi:MAG: Sua5/YciO/YrdC/YwlC family protein, partial [Allopontixanthobacter sediminis]